MDRQKWKTIVNGAKKSCGTRSSVLAERSTCPSSRQLKGQKKKKKKKKQLLEEPKLGDLIRSPMLNWG